MNLQNDAKTCIKLKQTVPTKHLVVMTRAVRVELFTARLEYSIEYFIELSSTRWILEVAINHRVVQNNGYLVPHSSL